MIIIGPGKVGLMLSLLALESDYKITGVIGRTNESLNKAKQLLALDDEIFLTFDNIHLSSLEHTDFIAITVKDDEISKLAENLSGLDFNNKKRGVVFHCSGHKSSEILNILEGKGMLTASLHPLKSVADPKKASETFAGTYCSVEGNIEAVEKLSKIVEDFKGNPFTVASNDKTLYHSAAVIACNYWIALLDVSLQIYKKIGIAEETSSKILQPLIQGTLNNFILNGIPKSLTGPIERGDVSTVAEHIQSLTEKMPEFLELYKILGKQTLDIAIRKGLSDELSNKILKLLSELSS